MVGLISPRSDPPLVVDAATGSGSGNLNSSQKAAMPIATPAHVASFRAPPAAPAGIFADSDRAADASESNSSAADPTLGPSPVPAPPSASQPTAVAHTSAPPTVPMPVIMGGVVGGAVVVAVILAFIYVLRIKRRVKSMKRCTDVLGPGASPQDQGSRLCSDRLNRLSCARSLFYVELAPMSPSQSSQLSFDSFVKPDGTRIVPPLTSDPTQYFLPLGAPIVTPTTNIGANEPLSPIRTSTIILGPPPAPRRKSILSPDPRSPTRIRSSSVTSLMRPGGPQTLVLTDHLRTTDPR
jgi:hypothetical protein